MLRLTLRSGRDGRFLARIVDRGTGPFVLDFGDRRIIDDATQRIQHGFTVLRFGQLVTAQPSDADLLVQLAEYYTSEGLLAFLDEPTWSGRTGSLEERLPTPSPRSYEVPLMAEPGELGDEDDATELVDLEDETDLLEEDDLPEAYKALVRGMEDDIEDGTTEIVRAPEGIAIQQVRPKRKKR